MAVNCLKQNGRSGARFWVTGSNVVPIGSIPMAMPAMKEIRPATGVFLEVVSLGMVIS